MSQCCRVAVCLLQAQLLLEVIISLSVCLCVCLARMCLKAITLVANILTKIAYDALLFLILCFIMFTYYWYRYKSYFTPSFSLILFASYSRKALNIFLFGSQHKFIFDPLFAVELFVPNYIGLWCYLIRQFSPHLEENAVLFVPLHESNITVCGKIRNVTLC